MRAATATTDVSPRTPSRSIPPPPTKWASDSVSSCFDEREDPMSPCQPEQAPHAIVTNSRGHKGKATLLMSPVPAPIATGENQFVNMGEVNVWGAMKELATIAPTTK